MSEEVKIEKPWGKGRIVWVRATSTDDSDVTYTVGAGKVWKVLSIEAVLLTTATVGNRQFVIQMGNGASVIKQIATATVVASKGAQILWAPGINVSTTARPKLASPAVDADIERDEPMPEDVYLLAGYTIRIWDANAVAAAADDMVISINYIEYDA